MKAGDTVYVIYRSQTALKGTLGEAVTAHGFYTRWGPGHDVYFQNSAGGFNAQAYNDEETFTSREKAKREIFMRQLRYGSRVRGAI